MGKPSLGPAEIVGSSGYTAVGRRKMMRAEGEFERHQLPAGIWRCGGGWRPQTETLQGEERSGGPGSEEPHEAEGIRRHRATEDPGMAREVGRKILRECGGLKFSKMLFQGERGSQRLMHRKSDSKDTTGSATFWNKDIKGHLGGEDLEE